MTFGGGLVASKTRLLWLPAAVLAIAGGAAWLMLAEPSDADDQSTPASPVSPAPQAASGGTATSAAAAKAPQVPPPEKPPVDGVRISSQSWRRGGLGSKALVTLTLRNGNDYAVRDIEIACTFARRDGKHLTDRRRVIRDTIGARGRKIYAGMLVGFVNINANKAKCLLVAASRT